MARRPKRKTLRALRPNVGIEVAYRKRLRSFIDAMDRSVQHWLTAAYRANEPRIATAMDALPAAELQKAVRALAKRWQQNFDDMAPDLAEYFATSTARRTDATLRAILKQGGFSVRFRQTPASRDILRATIEQNVSLIRSIPSEYFTEIEGMVMRSVQTGRDLAQLSGDLRARFGITRRRADLIARDQNAKATSAIQKARQIEIGLTHGVWIHSGGGKKPRRTHVANDGKTFDIAEGWFDPDPKVRERIMPGQLVNCRCVWRAVVPSFD